MHTEPAWGIGAGFSPPRYRAAQPYRIDKRWAALEHPVNGMHACRAAPTVGSRAPERPDGTLAPGGLASLGGDQPKLVTIDSSDVNGTGCSGRNLSFHAPGGPVLRSAADLLP